MSTTTIDARKLAKMFYAGAANLEANKDWINELNVFPVPDGDTGTNMTLTIRSAVKEVSNLGDTEVMKDICKAFSSGSLRGARGNSGVILSQLLRGFGKVARNESEITVPITADGFDRAVETAYKAVMKPKEGTILTVAKGVADKARELADAGVTDFDEFIPQVLEEGDRVLASTPDMLPVLKQAGVVDSGGQGLVQFLKGCYDGYLGKEVDYAALAAQQEQERKAEKEKEPEIELKYIYRTKYTVLMKKGVSSHAVRELNKYLETIGDNISVKTDEDVKNLSVSLHTNDPGLAIQRGLKYGEITSVKVENLKVEAGITPSPDEKAQEPETQESSQPQEPEAPRKEVGFITVAVGDGIEEVFKGLGVDYIIAGGQTMNPSTEDVLSAIDKVNADTIFIMPNNKNIVMAANQAAELTKDKNVVVVPTRNIPQGITAIINYMPDLDAQANKENMLTEIASVKTAEITYSVRDTEIDGFCIKKDDMMGIGDDGIVCVGKDLADTSFEAASKIVSDETEIITIYYGKDVKEEDGQALRDRIAEKFSSCDVELQNGGQPIYYYIISAE